MSSYQYSGLGDRLSQSVDGTVTNYTLDLNADLTQVLADGTNVYTYGLGRVSQTNTTTEYFLGDALGSVRQLTNTAGEVTYAKSYDPYGVVTQTSGEGQSAYGYTGEQQDSYIKLIYLRARYYASDTGRFTTRDSWQGDYNRPLSLNRWNYVEGNPVNYADPTGKFPIYCHAMPSRLQFEDCVRNAYGLSRPRLYDLAPSIYADDQPGCDYEVSPEFPIPYDGRGYLEGFGLTDFGVVNATEEVYDFTTMTSATFDISGFSISDSIIGYALNTYFGVIGDVKGSGFSSQRSIDDYSGGEISDSRGGSLPTGLLPTAGISISNFMGWNLNPIRGHTYGTFWGQSGDPIPVLDIGASYTNATMIGAKRKHTLIDSSGYEYVDVARLRQEIILGNRSPWNDPNAGALFYGPLLPARLYAATMVDKWAKIYNELHNGK